MTALDQFFTLMAEQRHVDAPTTLVRPEPARYWFHVAANDGVLTWGDYYETSAARAIEQHFVEHEELVESTGLTIEVRRINK
jgi:hypothetical protein